MSTPPAIDSKVVMEFVGVAHGDIDRVRVLLAEEPKLANACWDWGGGDFETALGAAAHMGRRDIAELLLSKGARLDIFAAAMLGMTDVVHAAIDAHPETLNVLGPHGIPLQKHAEAGGDRASGVLALLTDRQAVPR